MNIRPPRHSTQNNDEASKTIRTIECRLPSGPCRSCCRIILPTRPGTGQLLQESGRWFTKPQSMQGKLFVYRDRVLASARVKLFFSNHRQGVALIFVVVVGMNYRFIVKST